MCYVSSHVDPEGRVEAAGSSGGLVRLAARAPLCAQGIKYYLR